MPGEKIFGGLSLLQLLFCSLFLLCNMLKVQKINHIKSII